MAPPRPTPSRSCEGPDGAADGSVVIAQVGFSTNLARLLASDAELVRRKVKLLSVMFGHFPEGRAEYNVKTDIPAAQKLVNEWPSPIVFSGFEIGQALLFPATSIERDFAWAPNHPVVDSYRAYQKMPYDRPTWDLTSVLYAIRPDANYFNLSAPGKVPVDEQGGDAFRRGLGRPPPLPDPRPVAEGADARGAHPAVDAAPMR